MESPWVRLKFKGRDTTMSEMAESPAQEVDDLVPGYRAGQPTGMVSLGLLNARYFARASGAIRATLLYRRPLNWTAFAEVQRMAGPLPALRE